MAKSMKELKQENMFLKRKCETSDIIRIELLKWLVGLHVQVFILSVVNNNYVISIHHKTILHKMDNSRFSCCLVHPPLWQALYLVSYCFLLFFVLSWFNGT